jgi:hypothetical protein
MATSKKVNLGKTKKLKPSGNAKFIKDWIFDPSNPVDYAMLGAGRVLKPAARAIGGIGKAGKKYVNRVYRNMGK